MKSIKLSTNDIKCIQEITAKWLKSDYSYSVRNMAEAWSFLQTNTDYYTKAELKVKFWEMIETNFSRIENFTCFRDVKFDYRDVVIAPDKKEITEKKTEISKEEIKNLVINNNLTLDKLIDVVIELNGFIGVGLISLGDDLQRYCYSKCK